MTGGNRIVALEQLTPQGDREEFVLTEEAPPPAPSSDSPADSWDWELAEEAAPARGGAWKAWAAPGLALLAILGWTAAFAWARRDALLAAPTLDQVLDWIAAWSGPVLLVCVVWLLAMRTSRREAARFGDAARLLNAESEALSQRLASVNAELSLAREFIAAQSRDLEALGRVAVERLSQNAQELQALIHTNGAQVEAIGAVSGAALDNMEKLRGQLPVITNAARDLTSNIGNAGRTAHVHLQEMIAGFKRLNEFGQASERQVETLRKSLTETMGELNAGATELEAFSERRMGAITERGAALRNQLEADEARALARIDERAAALEAALAEARTALAEEEDRALSALGRQVDALAERTRAAAATLEAQSREAAEQLRDRLQDIDAALAARHESQRARLDELTNHGESIGARMDAVAQRLSQVVDESETAHQRLAENAGALVGQLAESRIQVAEADREIAALTDAGVRLLEIVQAGSQHSRDKLPPAIAEAEDRLAAVEQRIAAMREAAGDVAGIGDQLDRQVGAARSQLTAAYAEIEQLHARLGDSAGAQAATLATIRETLDTVLAQSAGLTERIEHELAAAIERIVAERGELIVARVEQATQRAGELGRETAINLRDQLARIDELAGNLERRVAHARERAEERIENDFARRVALITESLNSNAIDIARALDSEVSETAWAGYLKGDRGIFTRRAVSLIDAGEAKAIVQVYENDDEFREHVNRYIHDFEAMLRQVLSTRDGHALGVTLLSSDMGKLYVALAQAIERLRR
jgi:chromosome segregation ATPase